MTRAVITGVGVVSPFGIGTEVFWEALASGKSAVGPVHSFDASSFPTRVAGEVPVGHITAGWMLDQVRLHRLASEQSFDDLTETFGAWERAGVLRDRKVAFGLLAALEAW